MVYRDLVLVEEEGLGDEGYGVALLHTLVYQGCSNAVYSKRQVETRHDPGEWGREGLGGRD